MTCKDCLYYEACGGMFEVIGFVGNGIMDNADKLCDKFRDKSRFVELPCKIGDTVYTIYDDCTFPGDCYTRRKCKGCEYRNLFIEEQAFSLVMLAQNGKLKYPYFPTREAAEEALKEREDKSND